MTAQFPQSSTVSPRVTSDNPTELTAAAESRATFWKYPAGSDCSVTLNLNKGVTATRRKGVWSFR